MNKSKRIAISLVAGVLAALLCMVYGSSIRSQAEQVQAETLAKYGGDRVEVCVAARDIDVGETLDETNVITQEWLTSLLPRDAATELRQVRGDVTTSRIPKNAVICNVYTKAESRKLEVPKGKVAVSVAVDAEHSVGGATGVGSYVDVYVQKDGVTDRLCGAHVIDINVFVPPISEERWSTWHEKAEHRCRPTSKTCWLKVIMGFGWHNK